MPPDADVLDVEVCSKLGKLVETLTHSGLKILDEKLLKEVKKICKSSNTYVERTYYLILHQLQKKHSEIRFSAFQMCIELFNKSSVFRELLVKDLQLVFELSAETNPKKPLPPPKAAAADLKTLAISTLQKWKNEFSETYKQLLIGYNFLKYCKQVDFKAMEMHNSADHALHIEREKRLAAVSEEKIKALKEEISSTEADIEAAVTTLANCISLLLPSPENFFVVDNFLPDDNRPTAEENRKTAGEQESESEDDESSIDFRTYGINPKFSVPVTLNLDRKISIKRNDENSIIIENAKDSLRLIIHKFLPMVKKWTQTCTKHSMNNSDDIKKVLTLKKSLEDCVRKYKELNVDDDSNDDTSDDDFEEVKKDGYEESVENIEETLPVFKPVASPKVPKLTDPEWKLTLGEDETDPTTALPTLKDLKSKCGSMPSTSDSCDQGPSTSSMPTSAELFLASKDDRKRKLLASAPKLPFDVDLYHWEDEKLTAPTLLSVKLDNPKFWGTTTVDDMDEIPNPEGVAALRTRIIEFSGTFEPVKWSCRAPLKNGQLCPRKDRHKCPFHGKIVARDETGKCQNEEDDKSLKANVEERQQTVPEWQDPQLLEELKKATGIDLKMPDKKGKRKKKSAMNPVNKKMKTSSAAMKEINQRHFPGLTETVSRRNSIYTRLSKKLFNRRALRRVATALNKIDRKRFKDKFGDQFNYVYGTS